MQRTNTKGVMSNLANLNTAPAMYANLGINHDMTKQEREFERRLYEEPKKQNGEN